MNLLLGRSRLGRHILAGKINKAATVIVDYPQTDSGFVISFYDALGIRTGQISSEILTSPLASLEFEITSTGCGAFTLTLDKKNAISIAYNQRIDISLFGHAIPWYSGYVIKKPQLGNTDDLNVYSGFGFFNQLDDVIISKTYENEEISSIVNSMMTTDIESKTDVVYNSGKIYATDYTATKLAFDYIKAKESIKTLAEFATDYIYGVDEYRELFFKPINIEINENSRFWVSYHVQDFKPEEDTSTIVNFFYVKGGSLSGEGSNLYSDGSGNPIPFYNQQSIDEYGRKEDVLSVPSAMSDVDTQRWGNAELARKKIPQKSAKVDKFIKEIAQRNIRPEGLAQITTEDGLYTYQYPIKSVKYKLSSNGIQFSMQLGEYSNRLDKYIAKLYRDAKNAEFAQSLNNKQLSGVTP